MQSFIDLDTKVSVKNTNVKAFPSPNRSKLYRLNTGGGHQKHSVRDLVYTDWTKSDDNSQRNVYITFSLTFPASTLLWPLEKGRIVQSDKNYWSSAEVIYYLYLKRKKKRSTRSDVSNVASCYNKWYTSRQSSICLSVCLSVCLSIYIFFYLSIYLSLSLYRSILYLPTYLPTYQSTYLPGRLSVCLSACLPTCLPACLPACLPTSMPACLPACLPVGLSIYLSIYLS